MLNVINASLLSVFPRFCSWSPTFRLLSVPHLFSITKHSLYVDDTQLFFSFYLYDLHSSITHFRMFCTTTHLLTADPIAVLKGGNLLLRKGMEGERRVGRHRRVGQRRIGEDRNGSGGKGRVGKGREEDGSLPELQSLNLLVSTM